MNVTLEVNPGDLNVEFIRLMQGVSEEQRMAMIEKVMLAWIFQNGDADRDAFVAMATERSQHAIGYYSASERIREYRSPKEKVLMAMAEGVIAGAKKRTMDMMASDSRLEPLWEKSRDFIVSHFPEMVQNAMVRWFAGRFQALSDNVVKEYSSHGEDMVEALAQSLGIKR